jgi:hypothetical protein
LQRTLIRCRPYLLLVGTTGFEPVTTTPPVWCATRLRYAPNQKGAIVLDSIRIETMSAFSTWERKAYTKKPSPCSTFGIFHFLVSRVSKRTRDEKVDKGVNG